MLFLKCTDVSFELKRSIYGFYFKSAPFFGDLKKIPETNNNSRFYILKLYFLLHYNHFPVVSPVC